MNNWTIRMKLYGVTVGISVLLIVMGYFSINSLGNVNNKAAEIAKSWMPRIGIAGEINTLTSDYRTAQYNHVVAESPEKMAAAEKMMADLDLSIKGKLDEYEKLVADQQGKAALLKIKEDWQQYEKDAAYVLTLSRQMKTKEAGIELQGKMKTQYDAVSKQIGQLNISCIENGNKASAEGDVEYEQTSRMLVIAIVVIIVLVAFALILITKKITSGLLEILQAAEKIADGDLKVEVRVSSGDEIGMLANATLKMVSNLKELIGQMQKTSSQVAASSEELTASADQSSEVTQTIARSITDVAELSSKQVNSINSMTHVIEQISAGIQESAATVGLAADQTKKAVNVAETGNETLNGAVQQMNNIEETVNKSAQVVTKLGLRSKEIGQIVDTISGIAGQTNLLALNAAIEAARAGEQGKGFAVVAEEVRKLAEQSQEAAKRIERLISEIQGDTEEAVVAMNQGTQEVRVGTSVVSEVGKAFTEIKKMVNMVNENATEMARTMEELANGAQQIVGSVREIDQSSKNVAAEAQSVSAATEEQSASMEEIAAASRNLANLAQDLQLAGSKFRL